MRTIAKLAIGAAMACGAAVAATAPAAAQVSFGIGVGVPPVAAPAYPYGSCYDAYGNYLYSPYCSGYYPGYYGYGGPVVAPYFGVGLGFGGWGGHYDHYGHGYVGGRGYVGGGHVAMGGGGHFGGGGHRH